MTFTVQLTQLSIEDTQLYRAAKRAFGHCDAEENHFGNTTLVWPGLKNVQRKAGDTSEWIATEPATILWLQLNMPADARAWENPCPPSKSMPTN